MSPHPVIVIGAGLGGLAAATALANRGYEVLLLDKEPRPGGYAVSYRLHGYLFDPALHVVPACRPGSPFHDALDRLGVASSLRFLPLPQGFRVQLGDTPYPLPNAGHDAFFDALANLFPSESASLRSLSRRLAWFSAGYAPLLAGMDPIAARLPPFLLRAPFFLHHATCSTHRLLAPCARHPALRALLYSPCLFFGVPSTRLPALTYMMMTHLLLDHGMFTIAGGGQALTTALAERFRRAGGAMHGNAPVRRILIQNGSARGVELEDGTRLHASAVVCAVNLPCLVDHLIGRNRFPSRYLRHLDALHPSLSCLVLHAGLDQHPATLGFPAHISLVLPDPDIDACIRRQAAQRLPIAYSATARANADPEAESDGRHTLCFVGGVHARSWLDTLPASDYRTAKEQAADRWLANIEKHFPDLAGHVTFRDLATPRTLARYTAAPDGAILGFQGTLGMHPHMFATSRIPLRGIALAGAWTHRMGGFMPSIQSGMAAANATDSFLAGRRT